jgi:hypothetical protein
MKATIAMMLAALFVAALSGCGGGSNAANNAAPANNAKDDHDHDAHTGTPHKLGGLTLEGGMTASITQIGEPKLGEETIFEVKLTKDGKDVADAAVSGWLAGEDGKELAAAGNGTWEAAEGMYDVHVNTPKELPGKVKLWIRVVASDGTEGKGSVDIHKH